eukprot:s6122_g1.t1
MLAASLVFEAEPSIPAGPLCPLCSFRHMAESTVAEVGQVLPSSFLCPVDGGRLVWRLNTHTNRLFAACENFSTNGCTGKLWPTRSFSQGTLVSRPPPERAGLPNPATEIGRPGPAPAGLANPADAGLANPAAADRIVIVTDMAPNGVDTAMGLEGPAPTTPPPRAPSPGPVTTPPPRARAPQDNTPSSHPLEAVVVQDEPPVNQNEILKDYLKQVLDAAGLVSREHYAEVVSIIQNMDQVLRDMRTNLKQAKDTWRADARRVSTGNIFARVLHEEDRRRVTAGLAEMATPALAPPDRGEFDEDAFIRSWATDFLGQRNLSSYVPMLYRELKVRNNCALCRNAMHRGGHDMCGRGGGLARCFPTKKLFMEVGLFVANTIANRTVSRDLFGKRYVMKQQEVTAESEGRKRARKTIMKEAQQAYFRQIENDSRQRSQELESQSFLAEITRLAASMGEASEV